MHPPLIDFLNHGVLPFVGRQADIEMISRFWRSTADAHSLRAALLVGEAGIGKSRLVEEGIRHVATSGGAVVHARLFPGATSSLPPLLASAIWNTAAGRRLLSGEPEPTLNSVASAVRRMCRLRPTLVVVEDIHLLHGEPLGDFARLLELLSEEALSLLCPCRPVDEPARAVLERHLVDELRLRPLSMDALAALWLGIFGSPADPQIVGALARVTLGNPLTVRSALRGAIVSRTIGPDQNGVWGLCAPMSRFVASLENHVAMLSDGMSAQLTAEEKSAAGRLAWLGELFSRETAAEVVADADRVIESLTFKGILSTSASLVPPLCGIADDSPLIAFTHTLLHREFMSRTELDRASVVRTLALRRPLYAIQPFDLLSMARSPIGDVDEAMLQSAIRTALGAALAVDASSDWMLSTRIWKGAAALVDAWDGSPHERAEIEAAAIHCRLCHLRRDIESAEHPLLTGQLLALTESPDRIELAKSRLLALGHLLARRHGAADRCEDAWRQMTELLERFPTLRTSRALLYFLRDLAAAAAVGSNASIGARIERLAAELRSEENLSRDAERILLRDIEGNLLWMFDTPAELERRLRTIDEIERSATGAVERMSARAILLYDRIGWIDKAIEEIDRVSPRLSALGERYLCSKLAAVRIICQAARGDAIEEIVARVDTLLGSESPTVASRLRPVIGERLIVSALILGRHDVARDVIDRYLGGTCALPAARATLSIDQVIDRTTGASSPLLALSERLADRSSGELESLLSVVDKALRSYVTKLDHIVELSATIALLEALDAREDPIVESLRRGVEVALGEMLRWMERNGLDAFMASVLERHGGWLAKDERDGWYERITIARGRRQTPTSDTARSSISISMLGAIEIRTSTGQTIRPRAGRIRALLGAMVADRMLRSPLSYREFCSIVAGDDKGDPEHARKATNLAVFRLRELIGHDAVSTDGETPKLDDRLVRVDLLELVSAVREAAGAAEGSPLRAVGAIMQAIELSNGDVPFPGLYDPFFEAAREEIEIELRHAVIDVARSLMAEEDLIEAGRIVRAGLCVFAGDRVLESMLRQTQLHDNEEAETATGVTNDE